MHQHTQGAKRCPRCGCTLSLVPLFNSFAEECATCPRGPLPFKVVGRRRGTMQALIRNFPEYNTMLFRLIEQMGTNVEKFELIVGNVIQPNDLSIYGEVIFSANATYTGLLYDIALDDIFEIVE